MPSHRYPARLIPFGRRCFLYTLSIVCQLLDREAAFRTPGKGSGDPPGASPIPAPAAKLGGLPELERLLEQRGGIAVPCAAAGLGRPGATVAAQA